jgi:hypothetical protein
MQLPGHSAEAVRRDRERRPSVKSPESQLNFASIDAAAPMAFRAFAPSRLNPNPDSGWGDLLKASDETKPPLGAETSIMTEAATVFWYSQESEKPTDGARLDGRDRKFESVENAATFVMEKLSATERATSMIMTDRRSIYSMDIKGIYENVKTRRPGLRTKR